MDLSNYRTLVFDCDGVILHSNKLKTEAFYKAALPYGEDSASELVAYHTKHGGISRYAKFEIFLRDIVKLPVTEQALKELLSAYANKVQQGLLHCELASGLEALRKLTPHARWIVVSGGDQIELRSVFSRRKINHLFDAGIYGSPDNKDTILAREIESGNLVQPALFIGDSHYDYEAGTRAGLDFVFVSGWTELDGWETYCQRHNISWIRAIADLQYPTKKLRC